MNKGHVAAAVIVVFVVSSFAVCPEANAETEGYWRRVIRQPQLQRRGIELKKASQSLSLETLKIAAEKAIQDSVSCKNLTPEQQKIKEIFGKVFDPSKTMGEVLFYNWVYPRVSTDTYIKQGATHYYGFDGQRIGEVRTSVNEVQRKIKTEYIDAKGKVVKTEYVDMPKPEKFDSSILLNK